MKYSPVEIARQFSFVREAGANKGNRVEAIQKWGGGNPGDSWCCWFVTMILDICFQGVAPIGRVGACQTVYDMAKKNGWLVTDPQKDDIFLIVNENDHAHHIGFVVNNVNGIAGNTSGDGKSSNGDRVAEHGLATKGIKFVRYPK